MAFDFKKEYREFYMPKNTPEIVTVPAACYIAVRGKGNPNDENGEYKDALAVLYALAYTIKMSKMSKSGTPGALRFDGYYDYVVPPLEGFWEMNGIDGMDYSRKEDFSWISVLRLPDFIGEAELAEAAAAVEAKKHIDCSKAEFLPLDEGLCVQIMHNGPFDSEPATVAVMDAFIGANGYENDIGIRMHHEIYLSDFRKTAPDKLRTVIRHPIKPKKAK